VLLDLRHALGRHLDPEVAAGDHDAVDLAQDLAEALHRAGLLDLRHQLGVGALAREVVAREEEVVAAPHERHRDPIDVEAGAELQVLDVLVGQRRDREVGVGEVDPLVVREHPAERHLGADRRRLDPDDPQRQAAVVEEEGVAALHVVAEPGVGHPDAGRVARAVVGAGERERRALDQDDLVVDEAADADLGALQVLQDADVDAELVGDLADALDVGAVDVGGAVGEVEAEDVDARLDELTDPLGRARGGPEGRDDLRAARLHHDRKAARPR
jgi:hypothetical protein